MIITYNGTEIARSPGDGGFDAIEGFMPDVNPNSQWGEFLRGPDAVSYDRGNRKRTLSGTITPPSYSDLGTATQAALLFGNTWPGRAGLIIVAGSRVTSFPGATVKFSVKRIGTTVMATVTFSVGVGADVTDSAIRNLDGSLILNKDGTPITNI